jgi:uncharacterized protein YndB with AHSA1/START domain
MVDIEPVIATARIPAPRAATFEAFVRRFGDWWPREYTYSQDALVKLALGEKVGDFCFEEGPDGFRVDWARVRLLEAPKRLILRWHMVDSIPQPDPTKCSEVDVQFSEDGAGCLMRLFHRRFELCGEEGAAFREAMASEQGWPMLLGRFKAFMAAT